MTGRWNRNRDGALVFINGSKLLGAITFHNPEIYTRWIKGIVYTSKGERQVGMYSSAEKAKKAVQDYWHDQD